MTSATSEKANRKAKEQDRRDRVTSDLVIRTLMGTKDGRRWVWLELEQANIFAGTIVFGNPEIADAFARTAFREGQRARGLRLLSDITRLCPQDYVLMTNENTSAKLEIEDDRDDDSAN